ncbi:DUF1294 domain-containing protein [Lysobacter brunescens]|uniref:DUF1294 domain-containing protein n=1 Tax=Lysobacter brunescens TaxID=262323 RepID=A0ABW2YGV0_9GAMM
MRHQGRIHDWNDDKGFGFVTPNGGGDRAFVHIKAFAGRARRPANGDIVTYATTRDAKGRLQAADIRFANATTSTSTRTKPGIVAPAFALLAFAGIVGAGLIGKLPILVAGAYAVMSIVAFVAYGMDKAAANAGRRRTPESTLHLLGLACGWPGALLAQRLFRHKSRKREFQVVFWVTVAINLVALAWLASGDGRAFIASQLPSL